MEISKFKLRDTLLDLKDETARQSIADVQTIADRAEGKADDAHTVADRAEGKADEAQAVADRAEGKADDALNKISTIGLIDSTTDISSRSLANGNYTKLDSITLPPGKYEIVAKIRIDNSYTDAIIVAINDTTPTSAEICYQATTSTNRPTLVQAVKNVELSEETTLNSYVLVYGTGVTCSNSSLSAFGIKEV